MVMERRICEELTPRYYALCAIGGMLSAGTTHLATTPLDVLKVNMQVHPIKYYSISSCFTTLLREQGPSVLWKGWTGKFFGYGAQGGCRFGLYEYFKGIYSNVLVDQHRSLVFFLSSASAEVFANVALCPFEAIKVRVQAQPCFAKGLFDGFPKLYASEGTRGFYRGLIPLLGRNIPYFLYQNVVKRKKEDCSIGQQLGVTCLAGYAAGSVGQPVVKLQLISVEMGQGRFRNMEITVAILIFIVDLYDCKLFYTNRNIYVVAFVFCHYLLFGGYGLSLKPCDFLSKKN
ncbi:hypothetical protein Fmac_002713 [Flemingia macrophylla]|uniref:Mitochondrial phosphate carrier protein n=1 Tax=Flemingia macrophylla TaxID=520843 RepID=A0ABD1NLG9_9FABA